MSFMSKNNQTKVLSRLEWPTSLLASCINHQLQRDWFTALGTRVCVRVCAHARACWNVHGHIMG